jgi:UDP-N-acetylmuramoyl-tripeptide--D-alanyl-D-alanine ligase
MLELGAHAEALHRQVGRCVAELAPDAFFAVGPDMQGYVADEAVKSGYPLARVRCFGQAAEAAPAVKAFAEPGDCVLLKGSRGMRLERILNEL